MKVSEFIRPENSIVDVDAQSKVKVLHMVSERAGNALGLRESDVFAALHAREALGSTGIGEGIALPHARVAGVSQPFTMMLRLRKAIDFDAIDDVPVDIVFLLLLPEEIKGDHLNILSCIARQFRVPMVLKKMRRAADAQQFYDAMTADPVK